MSTKTFLKRLKRYDKHLDIEVFDFDGHVAIIDTSKLVSVNRIKVAPCVTENKKIFNRILHLKPHRILDGGVINELRERNFQRWARVQDYKLHLKKQIEQKEESQQKSIDHITHETAREAYPSNLTRKGVIVDGFKSVKQMDRKPSIFKAS